MAPLHARILVVEDDNAIADLLDFLLTGVGYAVRHAVDGCDAIRVLARTEALPDLILTDFAMPDCDARVLRQALLDHPRWRAIPVVLMSANPSVRGIAQELQVAASVAKPFTCDGMLQMVDEVLTDPRMQAVGA